MPATARRWPAAVASLLLAACGALQGTTQVTEHRAEVIDSRHFALTVPFPEAASALASALPLKGATLKHQGENRLRFTVGDEQAGAPGELVIRPREPSELVAEAHSRPSTPPEARAQLQSVLREIPRVLGIAPRSDDPEGTPAASAPPPASAATTASTPATSASSQAAPAASASNKKLPSGKK